MFGYVMENLKELEKPRRKRYAAVYCGICRGIRAQCSQVCRLALSYDTAFLSLLLMSIYEPEETGGDHACVLHPGRSWTDNKYIRYGADMNVALAYYNALDDYEDEERFTPELVKPERAIHVNRFHDHQGKWGIVQQRDNRVLEMLMEEGYFK